MIEIVIRLKRGSDLKTCIIELLASKDVDTAVVLSSVGCLSELHIRLAGAKTELKIADDFEIVSLNGTYSNGKVHLNISVADKEGRVYGGHLMEGCVVNTTCELVFGVLQDHTSLRSFDPETGYDEIVFVTK